MTGTETVGAWVKAGVGLAAAVVFVFVAVCVSPLLSVAHGFGIEKFAISARNKDGTPDVQAGSVPYALTTTFITSQEQGNLKDATLELPPGFIGDPDATPKCRFEELAREENIAHPTSCPSDTAIGIATTYLFVNGVPGMFPNTVPVYNLEPPRGAAAEFGFVAAGKTPVLLTSNVRAGGDYGLTTSVTDVNQAALSIAGKVTIWGVPAASAHDPIRGTCEVNGGGERHEVYQTGFGLGESEDELETPTYPNVPESEFIGMPQSTGLCPSQVPELPLLKNPTSCGVPRIATLSVDSWQEPDVSSEASVSMPEITGCEKLGFSPTVAVEPEQTTGSTPSEVGIDVRLPQEATLNPAGLAEGTLRDTTITLPAGLQINPSEADGLQACSEAQAGFTHFEELYPAVEPNVRTPQFTDEPAHCPQASRVANVRIKTPVLEGELEGGLYLASPQNFAGLPENPFSSLIALYLVAEEPKTGVLVKLAGRVTPSPETGQITSTFEQVPAYPFSDLHVELYGGERASLATPAMCGGYATQSALTPWSSPTPLDVTSRPFSITAGPNGAPCATGHLPFSPSLAAGGTNGDAGAFTSLSTSVGREDGQQSLRDVSVTLPAGVSADLTGVPLCPEAQANVGMCGSQSEIGEASASAGVGSDPYTVTGGKVYLTEHYDGAPFGLSIVTPAVAGPFNLGNVIIRAKIELNPLTGVVTVATTGEIPHILDGIPLQLKHVNVTVNRSGFMLEPTNCRAMKVEGLISGGEGAQSIVSSPFQVGECAALRFQPTLKLSTRAHSSKRDGANLDVKISYPKDALGNQSWIGGVKLVIPKQLPSELKTIQQACQARTFETDRAACPAHSLIGHVVVKTPILPESLTGPVYFVSYGSSKFPDAIMVLKGYGVTIEQRGETFVHNGITSVTFRNVPDEPIETIEVELPSGEYSEFGANLGIGKYDFCGHKLTVPTAFQAQNGIQIHEETQIQITGCPINKPAKKHAKNRKSSATPGVA
jgi:hypothetical protein